MAQESAKSFLVGFLIASVVFIAGLVAAAAYLNPWDNFGTTGFHILYNARRAKVEHLESVHPEQLPDVVFMGSSNVMRLKPSTLQQRTGLSGFNFGVFWGRADDFICITRWLHEDMKHTPKWLVIGLDTWTFQPPSTPHPVFKGIRRRLLSTPQLSVHHPNVSWPKLWWGRFIDVFNHQQFTQGYRGFKQSKRIAQPPLLDNRIMEPDGTRKYYGSHYGRKGHMIFSEVEAGTYPITEQLEGIKDNKFVTYHRYLFRGGLNPTRLGYVESVLDLADKEGMQVILLINPVHPVFEEALSDKKRHQDNLQALREQIVAWKSQHASVKATFDFFSLKTLDGDPDGFFDEIHYATRNADLIVERVASVMVQGSTTAADLRPEVDP